MILTTLTLLAFAVATSVRADGTAGETVAKQATRPGLSDGHWIDAWASMPQLTEPANLPPHPFVRTTTCYCWRSTNSV